MPLFGKPKYTPVRLKKKDIPDGLWEKCPGCGEILFKKAIQNNFKVCPKCDYHFTLTVKERISSLIDRGSFQVLYKNLKPLDPLNFKGPKSYKEKLKEEQAKVKKPDAVTSGTGKINKKEIVFAITDSRFMMGSMGSVVGEKITRATETATKKKLPLIIISGSGGGARMQEGMFSLMQMAKTAGAISYHQQKGLPYISVLTNPTMAGVMASFASLGDVVIAEPRALIGFTGPRVIEQTIKQKLPEGFQTSEFLLEHGLLDMVVHRKELKNTLALLLDYFS